MAIQHTQSVRYRIEEHVRSRILSGEFRAGSAVPTTQELADRFATSVSNAHAALNRLSREGLIVRNRGAGSRVARRCASCGVPPSVCR